MNRPVMAWILLSLIWGSTWLLVKIGVSQLPPFTFAWTRFVIAAVPMLALMKLRKKSWPRNTRDWVTIVTSGFFYFTCNYACVYWAEVRISSGLAAILYTTLPLLSMVLAHFFLESDRLGFSKLLGVFLGMAGVTLIFWEQLSLDGEDALWGAAAIVAAALATALGGLIVKLRAHHLDSATLTAGQLVTGLIPLCGAGLLLEGSPLDYQWTSQTLLALGYLAIMGTSVTFLVLNWLVKHMNYSKVQLIPFSATMIAVFLGWLILEETLDARAALGMGFILGGLYFATIFQKDRGHGTQS